jgi:hypothetical protein
VGFSVWVFRAYATQGTVRRLTIFVSLVGLEVVARWENGHNFPVAELLFHVRVAGQIFLQKRRFFIIFALLICRV